MIARPKTIEKAIDRSMKFIMNPRKQDKYVICRAYADGGCHDDCWKVYVSEELDRVKKMRRLL
jgi:hypothetical protein